MSLSHLWVQKFITGKTCILDAAGKRTYPPSGTVKKLSACLRTLTFLKYQKDDDQRRFKISYEIEPAKDRLAMIHERLLRNKCRYNLIYSQDRYLDILPFGHPKARPSAT